jgi:spermidine/putrescine transport system ATP-binding protein
MLPDTHCRSKPSAMIELTGVSKSFTTKDAGAVAALKDVSLRIDGNEFFTLLGPSGCGKTTLLRLIGGFETPGTGRIRIDALDVAGLPPQKRPVNTVFQSYALFPHMTVAGNVAFGLEMCRWPKADIDARVKEALALVRLDDFAGRRPSQLSGGQQQRVALARALAPKPKVLLLDEPLSALDLKLRKEMQNELKRLQRETGITFVLVTHDQEEALAMSDRIAVMRDGVVLQVGTPKAIYDNPNSRFVADFIGETNLVPGKVLGRNDALTIAVRPERVTLGRLNGHGARVQGQVAGVTFLGLDTLYEVLVDGTRVRARVRDEGEPFHPGDAVAVDWPDVAERELLH